MHHWFQAGVDRMMVTGWQSGGKTIANTQIYKFYFNNISSNVFQGILVPVMPHRKRILSAHTVCPLLEIRYTHQLCLAIKTLFNPAS